MKFTKKFAALFLAISLIASSFSVFAAGSAPGYKLVNTYDEDTGVITADLYVTNGFGGVGMLGIYYDTDLLDLGATVNKQLTTEYDISEMKISNFVTAVSEKGYTMTITGTQNKVPDLVNEDKGELFFEWYAGGGDYVDATENDRKIATIKFVVADDVDVEDLEKAGTDLIAFATSTPSNSNVKGYKSGAYCANEDNTSFTNGKSAKNKITLSVEFVGLEIEEEKETVSIKVVDKDGKAVEGAYVKIGSEEKQTDANGVAEFEASGSYTVYYKHTKSDTYVALGDGEETAKIDVPSKLSAPSVSSGTEKLTVTWKAPESTNGSDVTKYIVSYQKSGGKEVTKEVDADTLKVTLTSLTGGSKYTVKVKAVNAMGEGEYSDAKTATPSKESSGSGSTGDSTGGGTTTPAQPTKYTVTYDVGENGTITAGSKTESVEKGKYPANIPTVKAKDGYKFLGWAKVGGTVIDPKTIQITAATTFVAQYEKVEAEPEITNPFTDVKSEDWFYASVNEAYQKGLMNGVSATEFNPGGDVTRAMFVTVLYRMEGSPANDGNKKFGDVEAGSWYDKAVAWASANGIVNGVSDTEFAPNNQITREQMAAMIYRYASFKKADMTVTKDLGSYTDFANVSSYAVDAMKWVCGMGIINGMTETTLVPQGTSTRAQAATVFVRTQNALAK